MSLGAEYVFHRGFEPPTEAFFVRLDTELLRELEAEAKKDTKSEALARFSIEKSGFLQSI